ncbi:TerD family protein, partial [Streptomyces lunaelactis]|uniref:TerD family protein n=1 Tax=Streptomyces lunaelactis TaxID=1535768 RepID=UPI0020C76BEA
MTPGSNIPLSVTRVAVDVAAPVRLDVSGLLLTADGKVRSDDDFIFYNQPAGAGVSYRSGGGGAPDAIVVDTSAVPPGIEKIVVTASPDAAGQTFQGIEPTAGSGREQGRSGPGLTPRDQGCRLCRRLSPVHRRRPRRPQA